MKLYIKSWCPWCIIAKRELDQRGLAYDEIDVQNDRAAHQEMIKLSGQSLTPTLTLDGQVLADFGPEELVDFLIAQGLETK